MKKEKGFCVDGLIETMEKLHFITMVKMRRTMMMKKKGVMKKKSEEKGFWVDSLIETMEKLHPWIRTPVSSSSSNYHTLIILLMMISVLASSFQIPVSGV